MPFVFLYHRLPFDATHLIGALVLFVLLSSSIGIVLWAIIRLITHWIPSAGSDVALPLFSGKVLVPFIPAMVIAFWILLWQAPALFYFVAPWL